MEIQKSCIEIASSDPPTLALFKLFFQLFSIFNVVNRLFCLLIFFVKNISEYK